MHKKSLTLGAQALLRALGDNPSTVARHIHVAGIHEPRNTGANCPVQIWLTRYVTPPILIGGRWDSRKRFCWIPPARPKRLLPYPSRVRCGSLSGNGKPGKLTQMVH